VPVRRWWWAFLRRAVRGAALCQRQTLPLFQMTEHGGHGSELGSCLRQSASRQNMSAGHVLIAPRFGRAVCPDLAHVPLARLPAPDHAKISRQAAKKNRCRGPMCTIRLPYCSKMAACVSVCVGFQSTLLRARRTRWSGGLAAGSPCVPPVRPGHRVVSLECPILDRGRQRVTASRP